MQDEQCAYQALVKVLGPQPPLSVAPAPAAARRKPAAAVTPVVAIVSHEYCAPRGCHRWPPRRAGSVASRLLAPRKPRKVSPWRKVAGPDSTDGVEERAMAAKKAYRLVDDTRV